MISKIHWSWRQFRDVIIIRSFLAGLETTICGAQVSFPHPFTPNLSSHLCCHERTGWWRSNWVCPRVRETPGTVLAEWDSSVPRLRRRRFVDGRFGDEMWNVVSFGMSPKCKSSHCRREACRRKIRSSTCPRPFQSCCIYCDSWCIPWIWKCHYCIFVHR